MSELKACPFCGSEAVLSGEGFAICANIDCNSCGIYVDDWQTRPIEDALQAKLDEANAKLQAMEYIESEAVNVGLPAIDAQIKELQAKLDIAVDGIEGIYNQHEHIDNKYAQGAAKMASELLKKLEGD